MSAKRFLSILCLAGLLAMTLAPATPALGQGSSNPPPPYRMHMHDYYGYNYPLWVPGTGTTVSCANVFWVDGKYGQTLEVVTFHTLVKGVNYQVTVVPNYTGPESLEEDGVLAAYGTFAESGIHMVDLDPPITLDPDTRYAVILRQTALSRPALATDSAKSEAGKNTVSQAGESFVFLSGVWTDLHTWHPNTVACVQAWTWDRPAPEPPKMSVSDMEKVLEYILDRMLEDHPVISKIGFTSQQMDVIASVRKAVSVPITDRQFNFELQRVFAMIGEGQTFLEDPFPDKQYLNLPFCWLMDDGMIVVQDAGQLQRGDQILSLGGQSPDELVRTLWQVVQAQNEYWVRYKAEFLLQRASYLSYLGLLNEDQTVDIEILRDGERLTLRLPLGTKSWSPSRPAISFESGIDTVKDLGYFRLYRMPPSWEIGPLGVGIDLFFEGVRESGITNVVFDLRYAEGGYSHVNELILSYLDTGPVYSNAYRSYNGEKKPVDQLFRGDVYVLTSHRTSGAAVVLASLLHDNGIAVAVGEPTGEGPSFNYANASPEKLPVTGWTYVLARCEGQSRPRNLDPYVTSLYPDIPSYTTRADLLAGTDSQMGAVKQVIASKPEEVITPIAEMEDPEEPIDTRVWTPADLTSYVTNFSYSQKFDYFIIEFAEPIEVLNPKGIKVTDQTGKELGLRNVCIAIHYDNTLIVALSKTISDADRCIVTLPAGAVSLANGLTNTTMTLDGYKYNPYEYNK